jgi:hypothetical protein
MKGRKTNIYSYLGAVILTPIYLVIVTAHLFFTPGFQNGTSDLESSSVKKETQSIYYLIRNDRSTYSENKNVKVTPRSQSFDAVRALAFSDFVPKAVKSPQHSHQVLPIHRHVYLSLRVLRI